MAAAKLHPEIVAHLEWLGFVRPTGLVVSAPALVRAGAILDPPRRRGPTTTACVCHRPRVRTQRRSSTVPARFSPFRRVRPRLEFLTESVCRHGGLPYPDRARGAVVGLWRDASA